MDIAIEVFVVRAECKREVFPSEVGGRIAPHPIPRFP